MATFNAWHTKIEETGQSLETYGSIIDNYKNIVDIVGMDTLGID
jgi:hypothetical protein